MSGRTAILRSTYGLRIMFLPGSLFNLIATDWPLLMMPLPDRAMMLVTPPDSATGIIGLFGSKWSFAFHSDVIGPEMPDAMRSSAICECASIIPGMTTSAE